VTCASCLRRITVSVACDFFFQAEDGIRDRNVTGVQTCALPISAGLRAAGGGASGAAAVDAPAVSLAGGGLPGAVWGISCRGASRSEERRVGKEWRCRCAEDASKRRHARTRNSQQVAERCEGGSL